MPLGPPDGPRLPDIQHPERDESGHEAGERDGPPDEEGREREQLAEHFVDHDATVVLSVDPLGAIRRPDSEREQGQPAQREQARIHGRK
jgi:hypothetical protein